MTEINLTSLTCNKTYNPLKDFAVLRVNGNIIATFEIVRSQTKPVSYSASKTDEIELRIRDNSSGDFILIGKKTAATNPSAIPYLFGTVNYALSYD